MMKTMFDEPCRLEIIERINSLSEDCFPIWGKMNVFQMTKHCTLWDEWVLGKSELVYKQSFAGKIFGKWALKWNTKNDKPMGKNLPAGRAFIIAEKQGDLEAQKRIWSNRITDYQFFSNENFVHDFFGKMSIEEIGIFAFKHSDHHLRQFGM